VLVFVVDESLPLSERCKRALVHNPDDIAKISSEAAHCMPIAADSEMHTKCDIHYL